MPAFGVCRPAGYRVICAEDTMQPRNFRLRYLPEIRPATLHLWGRVLGPRKFLLHLEFARRCPDGCKEAIAWYRESARFSVRFAALRPTQRGISPTLPICGGTIQNCGSNESCLQVSVENQLPDEFAPAVPKMASRVL